MPSGYWQGADTAVALGQEQESNPWAIRFHERMIECEGPPWSMSGSETVRIASLVGLRSPTYLASTTLPPFDPAKASRDVTWAVVKMAELGSVTEQELFAGGPHEDTTELRPEPRSIVPLQWAHFGRKVLCNSVADTPCSTLSVTNILAMLNAVMKTAFTLDLPGLRTCLEHFSASSCDFGEIYGFMRPRWKGDFGKLLSQLNARRTADETFRHQAVDLKGSCVRDSSVPPRRIWDLFSNRVLPFYTHPDSLPHYIPEDIWTVSHSWVAEDARTLVWTPINGKRWPVPIPRDTTLDHVRVELLNLGAEYVWLDVLCLRQYGREEDEPLRKAEWGLDVPTIGNVYADPYRICVTYFNGLGIPFDPSPSLLKSDRHWLNRVWTVQEGTAAFLPGGLTGVTSAEARTFFQEEHPRAFPRRERDGIAYFLSFALKTLRGRFCTTELDRISGLAYMLRCLTLPLYDEGVTPEQAWHTLSRHLLPHLRSSIAFWHMFSSPDCTTVWPSWEKFLHGNLAEYVWDYEVSPEATHCLYTSNEPDVRSVPPRYYHTVEAIGPLLVLGYDDTPGNPRLMVRHDDGDSSAHKPVNELRLSVVVKGAIRPGSVYSFLHITRARWLVVEVVGRKDVEASEALVVKRCGSLSAYAGPLEDVPRVSIRVMYLSEEAAPREEQSLGG